MTDKHIIHDPTLLSIVGFVPDSLQAPNAWVGHIPFAAWLIHAFKPNLFVELGTHTGNSYFAFCQAVKKYNVKTQCFAVDTWQGDEHAGLYTQSVYDEVNAYHEEHYSAFSQLLRMTFDEALSNFDDASVDLLHIDGLHTYEAVKHDFESWLPKLAPGAIVLFHDTQVKDRDFGVWKLWSELSSIYPNHLEFVHSNGLGVIQIGEAPGKNTLECFRLARPEQEIFIDFFVKLSAHTLDLFDLKQYEARYKELEGFNQNLLGSIDQLWERIHSLSDQNQALNQKIANDSQCIADQQAIISEKDLQHSVLQHSLALAEDNIAVLTAERDAANHHLFAIRQSNSWKITAPLRLVADIAKGDLPLARSMLGYACRRVFNLLPLTLQTKISRFMLILRDSSANFTAIDSLIKTRQHLTANEPDNDPLLPVLPDDWPCIDISIVTFNSSKWISAFVKSLMAIDYPKQFLKVYIVDNNQIIAW